MSIQKDGTLTLVIACYSEKVDVLHEILQCDDVDIDICDKNGCFEMLIASQKGHVDFVRELLPHSAYIPKSDLND